MQRLLKSHRGRIYDDIVADLLVYDGSSKIVFENWIQSVEKTVDITSYDILKIYYAKTTWKVTDMLQNVVVTIHPTRWWWFLSLSGVWTVHSGVAAQTDLWQALLAAYLAGEAQWCNMSRSFVVALSVLFLCCLLESLLSNVHTFPIAFLQCVQSLARSSHDEVAMLAFLRFLSRTFFNPSCCPPHLWTSQDSWPYMMSLGSLPSGILTTCPAQHSWANNTMVETTGIPAKERTSVLGTLSHQIIFIRECKWCCCSWSIWHKCLWYGHHASHLYSRTDMTTHVHLALGGQPDVLQPDTIFQLIKDKAGYSGSWLKLQIQRSWW